MLRVAAVRALEPHRLRLTLTDGAVVDRDVSALLDGPVFVALREDARLFAQAEAAHGTVAWPNGADLCPDVLIWGGPPPTDPALEAPAMLVLRPPGSP